MYNGSYGLLDVSLGGDSTGWGNYNFDGRTQQNYSSGGFGISAGSPLGASKFASTTSLTWR
jgi:hypothetical protein